MKYLRAYMIRLCLATYKLTPSFFCLMPQETHSPSRGECGGIQAARDCGLAGVALLASLSPSSTCGVSLSVRVCAPLLFVLDQQSA